MRICALVFALAVSGLCAPAFAAEPAAGGGGQTAALSAETAKTPQQRLDELFSQLKRERNERAAQRIASRILAAWSESGSASIDLMMGWAQEAITKQKYDVALDFLDQVVVLDPGYAEGWNRRATVHFLMKSYGKSMADIDRTLRLEPRHFGALAGLAEIMKQRGRKELALEAYERILAVYPMMRSAQADVATISDELTGEGI
jgi:tetratricopeptide (TPR) repeat protein